MSDIIFISDVRLSFPNLAEPQKKKRDDGSEGISYNCELIGTPHNPGFGQFMQRYTALAQEKWKEHAGTIMQMIINDRKLRCFGQGHEKIKQTTLQPYDGYVGNVFLTVGNKNPPQMIDAAGNAADPLNLMAWQAIARKLYGGCRVNAAVRPWLQENKHGRGVRCDLIAIQFFRDDKPFGDAAPDASGMFGQVAGAPGAAAPQFNQNPWSGGGVPTNQLPGFAAPAPMPAAPFPVPPNNLPAGFGAPQQPAAMPGFFGPR